MAVTRRASQRLTLVMLVLTSVTLITLAYRGDAKGTFTSVRDGARDVLSPVQHLVSDVLHPIGDLFSGAVNYGGARNENQQLQAEIGKLRREIAENGVAEQQLSQLLSQLHLPFVENIKTVPAQVIDGAPSNFDLEIEIDRGTGDGVGQGMPVVAGPGLVGSIVSAGADTAMVRLVTDPRSSVGVRFGANEFAVVAGQGPNDPLALQFVQSGETVHSGEIITTSGLLGATFPADIPVGTVASVQSTPGQYTELASVTPYVDFGDLQYVTVLQWLPPREPGPRTMNARSWARLTLVLFGAVVFQVSVLDGIVVHHAHPDVMLLVAIGAGLAGGAQQGAVAAFATGLVADLFVDTPFGISALTFVLVAFVVGLAAAGPGDRATPGLRFATALLASAAGTLLFAGIGYVLGEPLILRSNIVAVVGIVTLGNAVLALPVLAAVAWAMAAGSRDHAEQSLAGARAR